MLGGTTVIYRDTAVPFLSLSVPQIPRFYHTVLADDKRSSTAVYSSLERLRLKLRVVFVTKLNSGLSAESVYYSGFLFCGRHGQVGGTRFQVGMSGADQRRYLRPDE